MILEFLFDEISKLIFLWICNFRLGMNTKYASLKNEDRNYHNTLNLEQFSQGKSNKYIDIGVYNGNILIEANQFLKLGSHYPFETEAQNYLQLIKNVRSRS